jgi:hypothetical protein
MVVVLLNSICHRNLNTTYPQLRAGEIVDCAGAQCLGELMSRYGVAQRDTAARQGAIVGDVRTCAI